MENKDIILFILVIIVLYLLYCDNKKNKEIKELKENFSETSSSVSIPPVDREIKDKIDKYLAERKDIPITESIKNLGILAKRLQEGHFLNVPGDFVIEGDLKVTGNIVTDSNINTNGNISLSKEIDGVNKTTTLSIEKSQITPELNTFQKNDSHSLNVDSSIKFTNVNSNGLRFPTINSNSQSAIYQKPSFGNLLIHSANSYINLESMTAIKDEILLLGKAPKLYSNTGKINMPNQILNELGGIEKLKYITPYYDFYGKKDPVYGHNIRWNSDDWNRYIKMTLDKPNAFVFVKHSEHRYGAPYIISTTNNHPTKTYIFSDVRQAHW